jgi:transposase
VNIVDTGLPTPLCSVGMYIKKVRKRNPGGQRQYEYLHLVENVRTEQGPRQRLVLNLGALPIEADQYKELANSIEGMLTGQAELFSSDPLIEKQARKAVRRLLERRAHSEEKDHGRTPLAPEYQTVDVHSLEATEPRSIGPEYVGHCLWRELGFNRALLEAGCAREWLPLIEALVVGRLVEPGSERQSWEWMESRSAIFELTGPPVHASLSALYRASDVLFSYKEEIEKHLSRRERDLFSLTERMCFFDLTNTYFEGAVKSNPKAKRGHSKEKRSDCPLLTLALIVDEQGFPKYSQLYPGNQYEAQTLGDIIDALLKAHPELARDRTVIIDAGIATEENIQLLKDKQFHYICVGRSLLDFSPEDTEDLVVIHHDEQKALQVEVKRYEKDREVQLLCRSTGRQEKDQAIRTRQERLFTERLHYFREGLTKKGHTKRYAKIVEMIGRLREKYPRASKLFEVEVIPAVELSENKSVKAKDIVWRKRKPYEQYSQLDGCYVLRTDREDLTDKAIWETYVMLTRIETAFRALKSSLGLRPNFHQKEDRADAHMFISLLAYHLLNAIEHRLRQYGDHRSWGILRKTLSTHQRLTIEYQEKTQTGSQRHHVRLCSQAEVEHKIIYQRLGLHFVPLPRKRYVGK